MFITFGRFGCFRRRPFFWPYSEGGIFIIFGPFSRFRRAVFLIFSTILAVFGGCCFCSFRPFWPFSEGAVCIIFGHFSRFRRAVFLFFSAVLQWNVPTAWGPCRQMYILFYKPEIF